jgi:3,4-dihydroxy 2-butanone 4-phosphate synthase/GTP cyclohydrolase II
VSIDAVAGNTTGISAQERGNTLRAMANPEALPTDFARPGHIFPLVAVDGGLQERRGHTEAGIALCALTHSYPVAVISEIVNDDGTMLRGAQIEEFALKHGIEITTIDELAKIAPAQKTLPQASFEWADLPLENKMWKISTYRSPQGAEHAILKYSDLTSDRTLLRIHSECLTGDVFGSQRCDCGNQLSQSLKLIEENGSGLIIYMRDHEGRGIGLTEKIRAYVLQDQGQNTIEANLSLGQPVDDRKYDDAIEILNRLNISSVELITHNPEKISSLSAAGIDVQVASIPSAANEFNRKYLKTKRDLLGHALGDI